MAVEETRPYELGLYDGSLDPNSIMVPVDYNNTWPRPKRYPLANFIVGIISGIFHIESGRLTGLTSHYVTHDFERDFDEIPIGRKNLHVYRSYTLGDGKVIDKQVPIYNLDVTITGFSFYIEPTESLTGVIVEYLWL
jgi:hypothetical protein